jgi:hypothetical protein
MALGFSTLPRPRRARNALAAVLLFGASVAIFGARQQAHAAPATHLDLSSLNGTITVGEDDFITVTALDGNNAKDTSYTGTIQFTSSCGPTCFEIRDNATNQLLPSQSYTFVVPDGGDRDFDVRWLPNAAGTQSLTVSQSAGAGTVTGDTASTNVVATTATMIDLSSVNTTITTGDEDFFTVTALNSQNNKDEAYTGTVTFTSTCGSTCFEVHDNATGAVLPNNQYTFVGPDNGDRDFDLVWKPAAVGTQNFTVTGTLAGGGTDDDTQTGINVLSGAATEVHLSGIDQSIMTGQGDPFTVTLTNSQNNKDENYAGTVTFSAECGDCFTVTPNNGAGAASKQYTFVVPDAGDKDFTLTWTVAGTHTFTATAALAGGGTDSDTVDSIVVAQGATTTAPPTTAPPTTAPPTTAPPTTAPPTTAPPTTAPPTTAPPTTAPPTTAPPTTSPPTTSPPTTGSTATTTPPTTGSTATTATTATTTPTSSSSSSTSSSSTSTTAPATTTTACSGPRVTAVPSTLSPGQLFNLVGACFPANSTASATLNSTPVVLGVFQVGPSGSFTATFRVPTNITAGSHTIVVNAANATAATAIVVAGKPFAVTGGRLNLLPLAAAAVFAGLVLIAGRRLADQNDDFINDL